MFDKYLSIHHFSHCSHSLQIFRMFAGIHTKNTKAKIATGTEHSAATFSSSTNSQVPVDPKMDEFETDEERLLHEGIPQKMPKLMHEVAERKRPNCAVYGAGLTSTGALAIPHLIKSPAASHSLINPIRIGKMNVRKIKYAAAGSGFSLFASTRELYGSGLNNFYQICGPKRQNDEGEKISAEQNLFSYEARNEADMWYLQGKRIMLPEAVGNIRGISAGRMHSIVFTDQNKVICFGSNTHGQCAANPLEHPMVTHNRNGMLALIKTLPLDGDEKIVQVHASLDSTFVLTKKGRIFAWGLGTDGQLGNGNAQFQWQPELVKGDLDGEQIQQIGGSTDTLIAVSTNGDLFVWGQNEYDQLGAITDEPQILLPRHIPLKIGKAVMAEATGSSCIVCNSEGHCFTWGSYVLGVGPKVEHLDVPIQLDPPLFASTMNENSRVKRVFASGCSMGALTEAGHLFTWGANRHGSLAIGHRNHQFFPFQVTLAETVKQASLGPDHSLFITDRY